MLTSIELLALLLAGIVAIETIIWLSVPEVLISLAEYLYDRPLLNHFLHGLAAGVVLVVLLSHIPATEILAVTLFVGLVAGMIVTPFGSDGVQLVRSTLERNTVWPHMVIPWLLVVTLVVASVVEIVGIG